MNEAMSLQSIESLVDNTNLTKEQIGSVKKLVERINSCRPIEISRLEIKGKKTKSPFSVNVVSLSLKDFNGCIPCPEIEGYADKTSNDFFYDDDNIFVLPTGRMILETTYKERFDEGVEFCSTLIGNYSLV